jgi:hypothetical protein
MNGKPAYAIEIEGEVARIASGKLLIILTAFKLQTLGLRRSGIPPEMVH